MASIVASLESYAPPSTWSFHESIGSSGQATGYELECLRMLEGTYRDILATVNSTIDRLNKWRPKWDHHYNQLDVVFTDEQTTLRYMELDLFREEAKLAQIQSERKAWEGSLPPGKVDGKSAAYRREKAQESVKEEGSCASKVDLLRRNIAKQKSEVTVHHQKVLPSLSVVNFAYSSMNLLSSVEERLSQEYTNIVARIPRPIDAIENDLWRTIFELAVNLQDEENRESLFTGLSISNTRSPRQTTVAVAGVCQKWRYIVHSEDAQMLWHSLLVEATNITPSTLTRRLFPKVDASLLSPINVDVITRQPDNMSSTYSPLVRWLGGFDVANLGLIYQSTPPARILALLQAIANKKSLYGLSLMCRDKQYPNEPTAIPPQILGTVSYLELVNLNFNSLSLHLSLPTLRMSELTNLCIRFTYEPAVANRIPPTLLYQLVAKAPMLKHLEVELGFDDGPLFGSPYFAPPYNSLSHLQSLKTRLSYFRNRLSFLKRLPLPSLDSITFIKMTSNLAMEVWDEAQSFLESGHGLGRRVKHLEIVDFQLKDIGIMSAVNITDIFQNLQTLSLRGLAVEYFLKRIIEGAFPLRDLYRISIWDSPVEDDVFEPFLGIYSDSVGWPAASGQVTTSGSIPETTEETLLRSLEVYRCPNISPAILDTIPHVLRGYGQLWSSEP